MTTFTVEQALAGELPEGFDTTLPESERLRQLQGADTSVLSEVVEDYGQNALTERDVVRAEIQRVMTSFQTPEAQEGATLELPGTALEFTNLQRFAAYYKTDNDTPSGIVKDSMRASPDDIVFSFATPEVYQEITGTAQDTFKVTGVEGGNQIELLGDSGLNETDPTPGSSLSLDKNEMLYFTGDYIDLTGGQNVLTKLQWEDVDGEHYGPNDGTLQNRLSATKIFTSQGAWIKSTADLNAKAYEDGVAEIVPVAFYMAPATEAPSLI